MFDNQNFRIIEIPSVATSPVSKGIYDKRNNCIEILQWNDWLDMSKINNITERKHGR